MSTTQKSLDLARQLQFKLQLRLGASNPTLTVHDVSFDTDSNPLILIDDGTPATTEKCAVIKIMPQSWPLAKDVLGNAAIQYTPHVAMLATEAVATNGTYLDFQMLTHILGEMYALGCQFQFWQSTNGTAPSATTFGTASNLKASFYPDMYNPLTSQQ